MSKVEFTYKTGRKRMLRERDAKLLQRLGRGTYMTRDMRAQPQPVVVEPATPAPDEALTALRAEYQEVVGKRPFHGWDADTLREKITEARE